jgi:type II secretory pathway component PulM
MYIVAIAWLYVVIMMSITERTAVAGVMTFLLYGVFPLTIVLYLIGTPQRKRNRQMAQNLKNPVTVDAALAEETTETTEITGATAAITAPNAVKAAPQQPGHHAP